MKVTVILLAIVASGAAQEMTASAYLRTCNNTFYIGIFQFVQRNPSKPIIINCIITHLAPGKYVVVVNEKTRSQGGRNFLGRIRELSTGVPFRFFELLITKESSMIVGLTSITGTLIPYEKNSIVGMAITLHNATTFNITDGNNVDNILAYGHVYC